MRGMKLELLESIREILIKTQHRCFILKDFPENPTATQLEGLDKKAVDYYLGIVEGNPYKPISKEQYIFHQVISLQEAAIARLLEEFVVFKD